MFIEYLSYCIIQIWKKITLLLFSVNKKRFFTLFEEHKMHVFKRQSIRHDWYYKQECGAHGFSDNETIIV